MWAKDLKVGSQAINARIETAASKPLFRGAWKSRRCLIPASGFYQWRSLEVPGKAKLPFYISRRDDLPLTFAGMWERWKDGTLSCTILTTEACDGVCDLHTRMPVMLAPQGFEPWLAGEYPAVDPNLDAAVKVTPVSPKMNSPKYNEPHCIEAWARSTLNGIALGISEGCSSISTWTAALTSSAITISKNGHGPWLQG